MKNILFAAGLCVLLALPIAAQTVTVSGSVTDAAGGQPVGTVTVAWPNFNYSGTIVQSGQTTKRPTAGSVSFTLYPGTYTVTYRLTNGNVTTVKWIVPASPSSTTIAAVQAAFLAPNTPTPIPIAQGGTGASSFTASKCVQVNSDGDGLEASTDACGTSSIAASVQSGTSYTVVSGDKGKALFFTNASAVSVTVPAASAITGSVILVSKGAGGVSASGGFTVTLLINEYVILISDGTTWRNVNQVLRAGSGSQSSTSGAVTSFNLDALLVAINALASNGFVARTSSSTAAARTITGTANEICVTNGDGVSGDPTSAICATFDISGKTSTKPMKTGTAAPGTCAVGEMFFDTNDTPGQNLYGCTSSNVWTLQSLVGTANEVSVSGGAIGLPSSIDISGKAIEMPNSTSLPGTCTVGQYYQDTDATSTAQLYLCTATNTWTAQGGAGSGSTAETYCVPTIVSGNLQISTPCKVLVNNVELTFGSNMTCDASSGTGTILFGIQGTTAYCWHNVTLTATNATALGSTTAFPADACALASATVTSGTVSDPVNIRLGRACPVVTSSSTITWSVDPSTGAGQGDLVLSGTAEEVAVSGGTVSLPSKVNLGGKTLEIPNGTSLPGTCVVGEQFMDTDATSGSRHYLCESTNTWALQGGGGTPAFSAITTATNTTATMTVGAGASIESASTGTIKATTQSQVFTADGTYTPGPGVTRVLVKVLGGGGGGNAGGFGASGNGGGGGAYVEKICEVTPGSGVTVTVGDGSAGATGSNNGTQGESSSFGTCAVALGGMGGQRSASRAGIGGLDDDVPPIYFFYQRGTAGSALSATPTFATYSDFSNASNLGAYTTAGNCANTETSFVPLHDSAGGIGGVSKTTNDGTGCPGNRGMMGAGGGGGGGRGTSNAGGAGGTSGNPFAGAGGAGGTHGAAGSAASANTGGGGGGGGDDGATFRDGGAGGSGKVEVIVI